MKKALVALIVLAMVGSFAFAAGESDAAAEGKVVVKTMAYGDNSNQEGQSWVRIVEAFQKANPDIVIDYEMLYDEAYHQKVVARIASGDIPHLVYTGADARWAKPWMEADLLFDHRPYINTDIFDLGLIPPMGPNGEIWEIPLGTSNITTVMFMNEKLVNELGFDAPETYEDVKAMVPAAKAAGIEIFGTHGADGWAWGSCILSGIIARTSGMADWVEKAHAGQYMFTDEEFVNALKNLEVWVQDGVLDPKSVLVDSGTGLANFNNGKTLFYLTGQWDAGSVDPVLQENTRMLPLPKLPFQKGMDGSVAAAIQVGYGLTKIGGNDAAVRDAAMKFLEYYHSVEETTQRLRDGAIVSPILKGYEIPSDMPTIINEKVKISSAPITNVIDAFISGPMNDAINTGCQKIVSGTATPEEVAAEIESLRP